MIYNKALLEAGEDHGSHPGIVAEELHENRTITGADLCFVNRRFMGAGMSQNYVAIYFFEYYQAAHKFEYVVEFGSQKGALSTYWANAAGISEKFFFDTFEIDKKQDWYNRPVEGAGHWFDRLAHFSPYINSYEQDVFADVTFDHVKGNVEQFKTFIFCDGGDKAAEFNLYAPLLKPGDRIAVHDWGHEIYQSDIQATCDEWNIVPDDHWVEANESFGTLIMPFRLGE